MPGASSLAGALAGFCGAPLADFVGAVDTATARGTGGVCGFPFLLIPQHLAATVKKSLENGRAYFSCASVDVWRAQ